MCFCVLEILNFQKCLVIDCSFVRIRAEVYMLFVWEELSTSYLSSENPLSQSGSTGKTNQLQTSMGDSSQIFSQGVSNSKQDT